MARSSQKSVFAGSSSGGGGGFLRVVFVLVILIAVAGVAILGLWDIQPDRQRVEKVVEGNWNSR